MVENKTKVAVEHLQEHAYGPSFATVTGGLATLKWST